MYLLLDLDEGEEIVFSKMSGSWLIQFHESTSFFIHTFFAGAENIFFLSSLSNKETTIIFYGIAENVIRLYRIAIRNMCVCECVCVGN
jgi:hypothetical protein